MRFFPRDPRASLNRRGKRAISVRAIEVLLYSLNERQIRKPTMWFENPWSRCGWGERGGGGGEHYCYATMKLRMWRENLVFQTHNVDASWKEINNHTDQYLVSLSSKTHVFEDKVTKYLSV